MKITQIPRQSLTVDDFSNKNIYRVSFMANGTLQGTPLSKVSIQRFVDDKDNPDVAYVEVEK